MPERTPQGLVTALTRLRANYPDPRRPGATPSASAGTRPPRARSTCSLRHGEKGRVKILYHHRTRSKDGQYVHIEEMIRALRAQGHEVIIVAPPSAETESFGSDAGMVACSSAHAEWCYELMELAYSLVAYRRLAKAVKQHKPDCLYERYNLFLPAGIWLARKYKLPMLLEVNAPILEERAATTAWR
jgi:hypothetical protein